MPITTYIHPIDQPTGKFRLLDWLENNFNSDQYDHFCCMVAFAKVNPFYKLHESIQYWNKNDKYSEAVFGIDHRGTSYQALLYALASFNTTKILHADYSTFHPKLYIFWGANAATAYYGSSNFTSGGLETNFEGGTITNFCLPKEQADFDKVLSVYSSVAHDNLPCISVLTVELLEALKNKDGLLMDETKPEKGSSSTHRSVSKSSNDDSKSSDFFGKLEIKRPRPIKKSLMLEAAACAGIVLSRPTRKPGAPKSNQGGEKSSSVQVLPVVHEDVTPITVPLITKGFVIQVGPHDNGEIFLSKSGVMQNPTFFGYPFAGSTVPKKAGNPTYPQRTPDPIVNIRVFDQTGSQANFVENYSLNTVYYTKKAEIRITITPSILSSLNYNKDLHNYPILVMTTSNDDGCDYDLSFFAQGSVLYNSYLNMCDQTLPSGGKSTPRKMGWF